jgi:hypothetical protein
LRTDGESGSSESGERGATVKTCLGCGLFTRMETPKRRCSRRYSVVAERIALKGYQGVAAKVFADQVRPK